MNETFNLVIKDKAGNLIGDWRELSYKYNTPRTAIANYFRYTSGRSYGDIPSFDFFVDGVPFAFED